MQRPHRVVIVGGGFGGLEAALHLRRAPVEVTLVDRRNHHLFQPLLYQVATGGLSPADIATPLRAILSRQANATVLQADVVDLDPEARELRLDDGARLAYDTAILATGATHHYFGRDDLAARAPGLKTIEDATGMRARILEAFERAERDPGNREALLTFAIVGAGPTGVELAGAIGELARNTLRKDFRRIDPTKARVLLLEGGPAILPSFPGELRAAATRSLERLGVEVETNTKLTAVEDLAIVVETASGTDRIPAATVLWAAGVRASSISEALRDRAGATLDRLGRVEVGADASIPGHPEILVIGDLAHVAGADGEPLPGIAPVAMQMGRYAARLVRDRIAGRETPPFRYRDRGMLAVIGRAAAVANFGRLRFSGYLAWLLWLFVHLLYIVEYQNRVLIAIQWGWSFVTRKRSARLITDR